MTDSTDDIHEDIDDEKYFDDPEYRKKVGCSIELWGDCGLSVSLVGLEFEWNIPYAGKCFAKVKSFDETQRDEPLNVYWSFGERKDEYHLPMEAHDLLECYYTNNNNREKIPSWFDYDGRFESPLFRVDPEKTTLSNFRLPVHASELFPWIGEEAANDRWSTTIACLNDPLCALRYDPGGTRMYPMGLLLTLIIICGHYDPSTTVPTATKDTVESRKTRELTDAFTGMLAQSYCALENLGRITVVLKNKSTAFVEEESPSLEESKHIVILCEAIILTMSFKYENASDSWYMNSDIEAIDKCTYELVMGLGRTLLHDTTKSAIEELKNANSICTHLKEGSFVQFVEMEEFQNKHPDGKEMWNNLLQFTDGLEGG